MKKSMSVGEEIKIWKKLEEIQATFPYTEEGFVFFANYCANKLIKGGPDITRTQVDLCKYLFNNGGKVLTHNLTPKEIKEERKTRRNRKEWTKKQWKKWRKKQKRKMRERLAPSTTREKEYTGPLLVESEERLPGSRLRMVQGSRGLGKTTFAGIYGVFREIHDPTTRLLIFSAGNKLSKEIANWCIQIIEGLEILQILRPDKSNGDRASLDAYDIHWVLRGPEKSPSIKCLGVDSNAAGSRADVLMADDIESMKNSRTVMMRLLLIELTKEFESICQEGDILYLGTPQFYESIYNGLPSRGFSIRIYPARYPTIEDISAYGTYLAPMLLQDIEDDTNLQTGYGFDGLEGAPTCPEMFSDSLLIEKRISQGPGKYQLQFQLNTRISDASRYPLKLNALIIMPFGVEEGIEMPQWCNDERSRINVSLMSEQPTDKLYGPMEIPYTTSSFDKTVMYIDPAGGGKNGDENGYCVAKQLGNRIYIPAWGGVPGGYGKEDMMKLVNVAKDNKVMIVRFEKNFGNGAFEAMIKPYFEQYYPVILDNDWATGQKEVRIIETIEPFIASHRLIIHPDVVESDIRSIEKYPLEVRQTYSGFYQLSMITLERDCLVHDDRGDAMAGAINMLSENIGFDEKKVLKDRKEEVYKLWIERMKNPAKFREDIPLEEAKGATIGSSLDFFLKI